MLVITNEDYNKILEHCKSELPNEACGLIGGIIDGDKKHIKEVYLLTNADASSKHFSIIPKEQIDAIKDMRKKGYKLLGNFHSHPITKAKPSEEDKSFIYDLKLSYVILSLQDINEPVLKSYLYDEEKNVRCESVEILI